MSAAPETRRPPIDWAATIADGLLGLISGVVIGVLGTIQHQNTVTVGDFSFPFGIVIAVVSVLAMAVGFRLIREGRLLLLSATVGMTAVILGASGLGPGGSVLVPGNALGIVWGYLPALICVCVVLWPRLRKPQRG